MYFDLDTRISVWYTLRMVQPKLKQMSTFDVMSSEILRYREMELDRILLQQPEVIAQRVERELIKRLQITAPYLIGMVIK